MIGEIADVLIVGAGLGGLAAARDLTRAGLKVLVLDKSRGASGRAASRWVELNGKTFHVDHGAQYFTARGNHLRILIPDLVERGVVRKWTQGFPVMSEEGVKARTPGHPRYACPDGMSALGKALMLGLEPGDTLLDLQTKALVKALHHNEASWRALLDDGRIRSGRSLILNMPAPQALRLSKEFIKPEIKMALEAVRFEPCWAVILVMEQMPYLDWVGMEIEHPVLSWAALDHTKRNVGDPPVLVLQASSEWSRKHLEYNQGEVLALILEAARKLFGDWVGQYRIALAHRWRYARPSQTHPWPYLAQGNLVFCGDWCSGSISPTGPYHQGRIEEALESGWAAAEYLLEYLKS